MTLAIDSKLISNNFASEYFFNEKESDPECSKKCENSGWCNHEKKCQCPEGKNLLLTVVN